MIRSFIIVCAAFFGISGIILDAIGSHALVHWLHQDPLPTSISASWQSAIRVQLTHATVLVGLAALSESMKRLWSIATLSILVVGVLLFSGSIYLKIILENPMFTKVAPTGGILLMLGWLTLAISVVLRQPRSP